MKFKLGGGNYARMVNWGSEAWNQNMLQCIFSVSVIRCKYRKVYIIIGLHSGNQKLQVDA